MASLDIIFLGYYLLLTAAVGLALIAAILHQKLKRVDQLTKQLKKLILMRRSHR